MGLDRAICGEDKECLEEIKELPSFLEYVDRLARSFDIEAIDTKPLIKGIDLETAKASARRYVPEGFVDYFIRRTLYFKYGGGEWRGLCSICGGPATLVVLKKVDTGIYQGYATEARCVCGSAWSYKPWKCPKCGVEGREHFDVYLLDDVKILKCKGCGHLFGEVEDPAVSIQLIHVKIQLLLSKLG